ncbi:MAG: DUF1573 domain-containing protein [candidate division Zixibacteria bacterium]
MKIITLIALLGLFLISMGIADDNIDTNDFPLLPSEFVWVYGFIPQDAQVSHHYTLLNHHKDTITITELIPGCDCTHVPRAPITIPPGEIYTLPVKFDSKTYRGEVQQDVRIVTDYEPYPEIHVYFALIIGRSPKTVKIDPISTVFIMGKKSQKFSLQNLINEKASVSIKIDHDSGFVVSESNFELKGNSTVEFEISPVWENLPYGPHYAAIVIELERKEKFQLTIPVKTNKF